MLGCKSATVLTKKGRSRIVAKINTPLQTLTELVQLDHPTIASDCSTLLTADICALLQTVHGSLLCYADGRILAAPETPKQILNQAMQRTLLLTLMLPRQLLQQGRTRQSRMPLPAAFGRLVFLPLGATRQGNPHFIALHQVDHVVQNYTNRSCDFFFNNQQPPIQLPYWHQDINAHIDTALFIGQQIWTFIQTMARQAGGHAPRVPLSPIMKQWVARNPTAVPTPATLQTMRDYPFFALEHLLADDSALAEAGTAPPWQTDVMRALRRLRYY